MRQAGALQHARRRRHNAQAFAGNAGTVLPVPDIAGAEFPGAAAGDGKTRAADQRTQAAAEDFVPPAQFAAPAGVVADVKAASGALVAEDCNPGNSSKRIARVLGCEGIGSHKESRLPQRLVELGRRQIAGTEKKIAAPLAPAVGEVHKSKACSCGEIECGHSRTVDIDRKIHERRAIRLLVCSYTQGGNSVLHETLIADPVELTFSGDACELLIEFFEIERSVNVLSETVL